MSSPTNLSDANAPAELGLCHNGILLALRIIHVFVRILYLLKGLDVLV